MPDLVDRPPPFFWVIPQGQHFHREFPLAYDSTTGELYDFTGHTARVDVVQADGTPVVSFATSGEDGVITLGTQGQVDVDLDATFTNALTPTTEYAGASHGPLFGDLVITDTNGDPWLCGKGTIEITKKVTS